MATLRLDKVDARNKLPARRDPYWQRLAAGQYLGFRKMDGASPGTWIARSRNAETGKQTHRPLGAFDHLAASARFDAARKEAEAWFKHLGQGGSAEVVTVKVACGRYAEHIVQKKGAKQSDELKARYRRRVDTDPIANIELAKVTREHVKAWRRRLQETPVIVGKGKSAVSRERSASATNRDMTALRAALNHAHDEGWATSDFAWAAVLKPIENADKRRDVYLDIEQRRALIKHAVSDIAAFLRGLSMLPLRPGALAALTVANFDKRLGVLTIGKDKHGNDRKIGLPDAAATFFAAQSENKPPAAPLLSRADGGAWNKDAWKYPIKDAARAAGLPEATTAYALRHSVITDLVKLQRLDLLTVAQLAGTSVVMIEKHYGHLLRDHATQALAALAV